MTRSLEEMLQVRLSSPSGNPPDLLAVLDRGHSDRAWVEAVDGQLRRMCESGRGVRLLACEYLPGPDGFLTLAACTTDPSFEVSPGDHFRIGFASMREGGEPVRTWPRLLREVCANGSLVAIGSFQEHEGAKGIGEAIERCFTRSEYQPALETLREAKRTVVNAREYLDEFQRLGGDVVTPYMDAMQRAVAREGDDSLYGLLNAVTEVAREVDDWGERLELEEFAGSLERLRKPVPRRSGRISHTLQPMS